MNVMVQNSTNLQSFNSIVVLSNSNNDTKIRSLKMTCNHAYNILTPFGGWENFSFTTSETKLDYY